MAESCYRASNIKPLSSQLIFAWKRLLLHIWITHSLLRDDVMIQQVAGSAVMWWWYSEKGKEKVSYGRRFFFILFSSYVLSNSTPTRHERKSWKIENAVIRLDRRRIIYSRKPTTLGQFQEGNGRSHTSVCFFNDWFPLQTKITRDLFSGRNRYQLLSHTSIFGNLTHIWWY